MMLLRMAWLNIWRNRRRTLITAGSVFFAVLLATIMRAATLGVYDNMIDNFVTFSSGYVQVHQKGYWEDRSIDNSFPCGPQLESQLLKTAGVVKVVPRLESFALASGTVRTKGAMVQGFDPAIEKDVLKLNEKLLSGSYPHTADDEGVLLGAGLAAHLKLQVRDTLVLIGQGYQGSSAAGRFPVAGIVRLGSPQLNDNLVFVPLHRAQEMYGADSLLSSLSMIIASPSATDRIAAQLKSTLDTGSYEVMTWMQMFPELDQFIRADSSGHIIIIGILYLIIAFGIFGTLLMMTVERTHEFGILIALGMRRRKIARMLMYESLYITLVGCILGMLAGYALVSWYSYHPIELTGQIRDMYVRYGIDPVIVLTKRKEVFIYQAIAILAMGWALSFYPGWRILKLHPVKAINS